jgi:hypothetical protein
MFFQHTNSLESLILDDLLIKPSVSDNLFQALEDRSYLSHLSLSGLIFSEKSFEIFVQYFEKNRYLRELYIPNLRGLKTNQWLKFMEVLAHNKILRCLDLSCNNFIENQEAAIKSDQTPY